MVKEFTIVLNTPPNGAYFPGSVVSGTLIVKVDEPKRYNTVQIALTGRSHVSLVVNSHRYNGENRRTAREAYIARAAVLWSKEETPDHKFSAGRHTFPFQFQALPQGIPPTFSGPGSTGFVQYYVEGRIAMGLLHNDKVVKQDIVVFRAVDINVPRLLTPVEMETEGTFCCLCCASAPITMTVHLPRTGFCVGEGVPVRVTLNNRSSFVIRLKAKLVQVVHYRVKLAHYRAPTTAHYPAQSVTAIRQKPLCGLASDNPMPARRTTIWDPGELRVPPVTTSMTTPNDSINVKYSLRVIAILPWTSNLVINVQLVIGNVPLRQVTAPALEQSTFPSQPQQTVNIPQTSYIGWNDPNAPPPYHVATRM